MKALHIREQAQKLLAHPVTFLLAINIACAMLGLGQFAFALAVLKPADFAVIGVLAAIGGVVTGLLDVKLADLATKLYYETPRDEPGQRGALLSAGLWLHIATGVATGLLTLVASQLLARRFVSQEVATWWMAAMAARIGIGYPVAAATTFLRLVGDFRASGWTRLGAQATVTAVTVGFLVAMPDLAGYFAGVAAGAAVTMAATLVVAAHRIGTLHGRPLLGFAPLSVLRRYLAAAFLVGGSLAGIAKLIGRSCDTLVVALLTNDTTTGIYRVARQAYDSVAGLTDAVHQFYTPTIVDCLARGRMVEYRRHRRRLMAIGVASAAGAVAGSWAVLHPIAAARFPHYLSALPAFEIFAGLMVIAIGVHGWLWPTLVASGKVGRFGLLSLAGAVAQIAAMAALGLVGWLTPTTAAAAAWLTALVTYGPLLAERILRRFAGETARVAKQPP